MSEETKTFMERVLIAQSQLKAPKGQYNSFGKYKYRNCEDILEAAKPILGLNALFLNIQDDIISIDGRFYVKATATIMDILSDAKLSSTAFAREDEKKTGMDLAQLTGACSSYARKYALNGLLAIDDTKDADSQDNTGNNDKPKKVVNADESTPPAPKATEKQTNYLKKLMGKDEYNKHKDFIENKMTITQAAEKITELKGDKK